MIDHVTLATNDVEMSKAFYEQAFQPLGYVIAFGEPGQFWAFQLEHNSLFEIRQAQSRERPVTSCHVAFRVKDQEQVAEFYRAALAAGALDNGAPGLRAQYAENYCACFVHDPDGHNIEAMTIVEVEG